MTESDEHRFTIDFCLPEGMDTYWDAFVREVQARIGGMRILTYDRCRCCIEGIEQCSVGRVRRILRDICCRVTAVRRVNDAKSEEK